MDRTLSPPQPPRRTPRMRDVAALAGVSVATVSFVLNKPERVSPQTTQKVLRAIETLGFVRNESARQLRVGKSSAIGLIVSDLADPSIVAVVQAISSAISNRGLGLLTADSAQNPRLEKEHLELFACQRVSGVIVWPLSDIAGRRFELRQQGIPSVSLGLAEPESMGCSVTIDNMLLGVTAFEHFAKLGHRNIAVVGDPLDSAIRERIEGMRRASAISGASPAAVTVIPTASATISAGRTAVDDLLGSDPRPTAALAANDLVALGLLTGLRDRGLHVPRDVALIGCDNLDIAATAAIPLSSFSWNASEVGYWATTLLLEEIAALAGSSSHHHRQMVLPQALCPRATTIGTPE